MPSRVDIRQSLITLQIRLTMIILRDSHALKIQMSGLRTNRKNPQHFPLSTYKEGVTLNAIL
jgi:hypothetical protein